MKLATWNINGIRSAEKEVLQFLEDESPDILGLQETKTHPDSLGFTLKLIPGYQVLWNWDSRKSHYSGTAIYFKDGLDIKGINSKTGIIAFDQEGRFTEVVAGNTVIINCYFPFGGNSDQRMEYKREFNKFISSYVEGLMSKGKEVVLMGDINIIHLDIDVPKVDKYLGHPNFLPRDREWMDGLLSKGLKDTFREVNAERGNYSWWPYTDIERKGLGCMRIDYILASKNIETEGSVIRKDVYGSDHCPVVSEVVI